jgi:hypothetical protein
MTETELQERVERLLDQRGLWWHHCSAPYTCNGSRGLTDLIVITTKGTHWIELKVSHAHRLSSDQVTVFHMLKASGQDYYLFTFEDLIRGRIADILDTLVT